MQEDSLKDTFNGCIEGILKLRSEGATAVRIGPIAVVFDRPVDASWNEANKGSDPAYDSVDD